MFIPVRRAAELSTKGDRLVTNDQLSSEWFWFNFQVGHISTIEASSRVSSAPSFNISFWKNIDRAVCTHGPGFTPPTGSSVFEKGIMLSLHSRWTSLPKSETKPRGSGRDRKRHCESLKRTAAVSRSAVDLNKCKTRLKHSWMKPSVIKHKDESTTDPKEEIGFEVEGYASVSAAAHQDVSVLLTWNVPRGSLSSDLACWRRVATQENEHPLYPHRQHHRPLSPPHATIRAAVLIRSLPSGHGPIVSMSVSDVLQDVRQLWGGFHYSSYSMDWKRNVCRANGLDLIRGGPVVVFMRCALRFQRGLFSACVQSSGRRRRRQMLKQIWWHSKKWKGAFVVVHILFIIIWYYTVILSYAFYYYMVT